MNTAAKNRGRFYSGWLAPGQSYECICASDATLNNMDKYITWIYINLNPTKPCVYFAWYALCRTSQKLWYTMCKPFENVISRNKAVILNTAVRFIWSEISSGAWRYLQIVNFSQVAC